ncbi:helicase ARIP4 [Neocloeon triangulifer]|uniref:helicase ARIP4 n=1 Tax=Neocloeon triangulifer TaxID=2078957 RepID=UPI00286F1919|nr:helicase ARIP4 [Neocloeon triangulifer]
MEPFPNLPGLVIKKIAKDNGVGSEDLQNNSPDQEDASDDADEDGKREASESDAEGAAESDESEDEDAGDDEIEPEDSVMEESEDADDEGDVETEDEQEAEKGESEDKVEGGTCESELKVQEVEGSSDAKSLEVTPVVTKSKKRKKAADSEKESVKKKRKRKTKESKKDKDDSDSDEEEGEKKEKKKRVKNLRKNIREVMNEDELDEETKAAQRQEMERLMRVQEQQKMLKEMQRKIMQEKQKTLLQSLGQSTSILRNCTITPMGANRDLDIASLPSLSSDLGITPGETSVSLVKNSDNRMGVEEFSAADQTFSHSETTIIGKPIAPRKEITEPKELVTISSSDDDCMIVSGGSEAESEPEDPTNSGLHTNDVFNIPDEQGRVLINVGHPESEPDIFLAPQIARAIKPHQIGGIRFMYDNVVESLERYKSSSGFGCILAHSMGLGKTLQVVSFCDIFLRHTSARHILCIMPINTLQNWVAEFNMWMPPEKDANQESNSDLEVCARTFNLHVLNDSQKTLTARAKVIRHWRLSGGVLLIGYELYRLLSLRRDKLSKKKRFVHVIEVEEDDNRKKALWNEIHDALIKPGPDLVICDEGHRIKNSHASISHALKSIQTKRRIVLTGYPLQNNLLEYWCMVDFVRPNYLGTKTEFSNMFERPIQNGQCVDSTPNDVKLMRYRAHVLHSLLNGFVQRRSHEVLQKALPQKHEFVLLFRMTPFQRNLYSTFMNEVVRTKTVPNPLKAFAVCCKIWNHPDVLYYFLKKRMEGDDLDLEEPVLASNAGSNVPAAASSKNGKASRSKKPPKAHENSCSKEVKADAIIRPIMSNQDQAVSLDNQEFSESYSHGGFGYGESSNQFNQQYQQNYFNSMQQQCYPQSTNPFTACNSQQNPYGSLPSSQNFGNQQQSWQQPGYEPFGGQYNDSFHLPPSSLETKHTGTVKNERLADLMDKKCGNLDNKEIDSIEKIIDEKIESRRDDDLKSLLEQGSNMPKTGRDETSIPYDWAPEILKGYEPGKIENSAKMEALFCILEESLKLGDRILLFSQSLFTLNLIEDFLHQNFVPGTEEKWAKNVHYFRLDGSTAAIEREKLINEFNSNPKLALFLVSTRAGSLGINLVGANRVIVFDASWNPCHDTQAVCRVYRYGQLKPCFVYRFVMDNCLEKKIYDRQINKQGMADRVVDELNPDAHLSMKEVSNLLYDSEPESEVKDLSEHAPKFLDSIVQMLLEQKSSLLSKEPFKHESLLVDRKEKKLSQAEKRLAKRSYELEKQASTKSGFNNYYSGYQGSYSTSGGGIVNAPPPTLPIRQGTRPVASVRPMQAPRPPPASRTRWIPAETWQRQGMTVQEMTLPIDVVIPTNAQDRSISLKAGQRVMVLKSPKGVYMQLENGKIIAIRSTQKSGESGRSAESLSSLQSLAGSSTPESIQNLLPPNSELTITPRGGNVKSVSQPRQLPWSPKNSVQTPASELYTASTSSTASPGGAPISFSSQAFEADLGPVHGTLHSKVVQQLSSRALPKTTSVPLPATSTRKIDSSPLPSFSSNTFAANQQQQQFPQTTMHTSGGGIVASQDNYYVEPGTYQNYSNVATHNQQYADPYSAFHRPDFPVTTVAPTNPYMSYEPGNPSQYQNQVYNPAYPTNSYTYQQSSFSPMYSSSSSQSGPDYSQPPM